VEVEVVKPELAPPTEPCPDCLTMLAFIPQVSVSCMTPLLMKMNWRVRSEGFLLSTMTDRGPQTGAKSASEHRNLELTSASVSAACVDPPRRA
jgi:hypothetical protein